MHGCVCTLSLTHSQDHASAVGVSVNAQLCAMALKLMSFACVALQIAIASDSLQNETPA